MSDSFCGSFFVSIVWVGVGEVVPFNRRGDWVTPKNFEGDGWKDMGGKDAAESP